MNEDYTFALREDIDTIKMMSTMPGSFEKIFPQDTRVLGLNITKNIILSYISCENSSQDDDGKQLHCALMKEISDMCDDIFPKFIPDGDLHRLFYKVKMVATIFSQF